MPQHSARHDAPAHQLHVLVDAEIVITSRVTGSIATPVAECGADRKSSLSSSPRSFDFVINLWQEVRGAWDYTGSARRA